MKKLIFATLVYVAALFLLRVTLGQKPDRRNYVYTPDMARTVAYKAQSPNPYLPHQQTEQPPPAGTIPRGLPPLHYGPSQADFERAGEELRSPLDDQNPANLARGKEIYQTYCQVCHGAGGRGDGPVVQRGFPPPPSLLLPHARGLKDGQIFYIVTFGYNNMPAYGGQIDRTDRWQAVSYVRKLQESQP